TGHLALFLGDEEFRQPYHVERPLELRQEMRERLPEKIQEIAIQKLQAHVKKLEPCSYCRDKEGRCRICLLETPCSAEDAAYPQSIAAIALDTDGVHLDR